MSIFLTERQRAVLDVLADRVRQRLPMPTYRELGAVLGIKSTNAMSDHLVALGSKGYINVPNGKARSVTLTAAGFDACSIPKPSDHMALKEEVLAACVVWEGSTQSVRATTELVFAIRKLRAYEASL